MLLAEQQDPEDNPQNRFYAFWLALQLMASDGISIFKLLALEILTRALSFTFSAQILILIPLLLAISSTEDETAAITLIVTLWTSLNGVVFAPLFGLGNVVSEYIGELAVAESQNLPADQLQQKKDEIAHVNLAGMLIATVLSPFIIVPLLFSAKWLTYLGQDPDVAADVQVYANINAWAFLALGWRTSIEQTMFSFKCALAAMIIGLITLTVMTGWAILLGFGGLGAPGVALANTGESFFTAIGVGLYLAWNNKFTAYKFFSGISHFYRDIKSILKQARIILKRGLAFTINAANEVFLTLAIGFLAGYAGLLAQSTLAYALGVTSFTVILTWASSQVCANLLSEKVGRIRALLSTSEVDMSECLAACREAKNIGIYGLITSLILSLPPLLTVIIFPQILLHIFTNNNPEIIPLLNNTVRLISLGGVFDIVRNYLLQISRVLGDAFSATLISFCGLSAGMIFSTMMLFWQADEESKLYGIAGGFMLGILFAAMGLTILRGKNIQPESIRDQIAREIVLERRPTESRAERLSVTTSLEEEPAVVDVMPPKNGDSRPFPVFERWWQKRGELISVDSSTELLASANQSSQATKTRCVLV